MRTGSLPFYDGNGLDLRDKFIWSEIVIRARSGIWIMYKETFRKEGRRHNQLQRILEFGIGSRSLDVD